MWESAVQTAPRGDNTASLVSVAYFGPCRLPRLVRVAAGTDLSSLSTKSRRRFLILIHFEKPFPYNDSDMMREPLCSCQLVL